MSFASDLQNACVSGNIAGVKLSIASFINSSKDNILDIGFAPLRIAITYGHLEIVQFLVASGASVNEVDSYGRTPLYAASRYGRSEIVQFLIASGG